MTDGDHEKENEEKDIVLYERRGATARNRLEREVRKARVRVERELRQRRRKIESTVESTVSDMDRPPPVSSDHQTGATPK